jgi:hypothetical protein
MVTVMATMWAMAIGMRLAGNKEGKGKGSKGDGSSNGGDTQQRGQWQWWQEQWHWQQGWQASNSNGNKEGDGDSNNGGMQAMAAAIKRAMVIATRVVGDKEGNGDCGKRNGNGNKVVGQVTAMRAMVTVTATRGQWQQ